MFKSAKPLRFPAFNTLRTCTLGSGLLFAFLASNIHAQPSASSINFGDNASPWAKDQECDDPRFAGNGMAPTLDETDRGHDASDCRNLFLAGSIYLVDSNSTSNVAGINFGDNSSTWANDGQCDDPRFVGEGVATTLLEDDRLHDANDCRELFLAGSINLAEGSAPSSDGGVDFGDNSSTWAFDRQCDDPRFAGSDMAAMLLDTDMFHDAQDCRDLFEAGSIRLLSGSSVVLGGRFERGNLRAGDDTRANGSYSDSYTFIADRGDSTIVDLRSGEFDTFLTVRSPSGEEFSNDDYEESFDRSLVSIPRTETGVYEVIVSSYSESESGGYTLEITTDERPLESLNQQISGVLIDEDDTFTDGEYYDTYNFEGRPGQSVTLDLRSDEFDTYLILRQPNGEALTNDDADGSNSRIEVILSEAGNYEVVVSSFAGGETGEYRLNIAEITDQSDGSNSEVITPSLRLGDSISGDLADGDQAAENDGFQDSFFFTGNSGDTVVIDLTANDFDTVLSLQTPAGALIENDDYQGSMDQSLIQLTLRESGRYRILVSSYSSGETGDYQLNVRPADALSSVSTTANSGSKVYGIFAGIADYPGTDNDLDLTDQDAIRARDALIAGAGMNPDNAYTLLNADATGSNFRAALNSINADIGADDTLVIFYSGHGDRVPRADGPNSTDPDGLDETIEFYDGPMLDDELAALLDNSNAGTILLVMDSCFSGGFSKDIISRPGRMGLFSSEEDVTSQVAFKFQAGGYLSVFFDEAIREGLADRDDNGEVTAIELSQYLHGRYRSDVKSLGTTSYVRTSGPQSAYQHLVVDRGGVGPYSVLFNRN
ncbi:MAG: pre-peptidase C-terminal domain-containing protein [Gammaproteobacteria bacterium]|nr:pre-peptidase C-terminal domain-containing protein [Gammaproteobacteria bacterium]